MQHLLSASRIIMKVAPLAIFCAASTLLLGACASTFADRLRAHPYCVDRSGIMQFKIDDCVERTHGHREAMNECLASENVPQFRISRLDECVESSQNQGY